MPQRFAVRAKSRSGLECLSALHTLAGDPLVSCVVSAEGKLKPAHLVGMNRRGRAQQGVLM
jgi:hypothetical protein